MSTKVKGTRPKKSKKSKTKRRKKFTPTKGGDGSMAVPVKRGPHWDDNGKVMLTGASINGPTKAHRAAFAVFADSCIPTADLHDRAHRQRRLIADEVPSYRDDPWILIPFNELEIPGRDLPGQVRRYHPSQMVGVGSRRVGFDSMFDHAAEVAGRLESAGIELGWHTTSPGQFSRGEIDRLSVFKGLDENQARNLVQQRTTQSAITREDIGDD